MAESCPQVDSDAAPLTNAINNGKRSAEEVTDPQVVANKKHKILEESVKEDDCSSQEQKEAELSQSLKLAATTQDVKKASSCNESRQEDEDDNTSKENAKHLESPKKSIEVSPAKSPAATQDDAEKISISSEYKEEDKDDSTEDDHQHLEIPNRSALDLAVERTEHHPAHDTGKTLFLGNLSFLIEEDDVRDFFKNVGEIANIRFAIKDDRFLGYAHIEFTTAEAAQEALKLNNEVLLDRQVKLDITRRQRGAYMPVDRRVKLDITRQQRGAYTPGNRMGKSNQSGGHAQVKTVYVRGFESSDSFDNIRGALEKHFGKCGEISRLYIPTDYVSGAPRGVAFIEFTDSDGFYQALGLDGSEIGGSRLTVEEAKKPRGDGREGYGGGRGSAGSYVRENGSGGSWSGSTGSYVRERGSGGGHSGSGGSWSRPAGRYVRESWSGGGWRAWSRESGSGGGWSGSGGSYGRESGSGGDWSGSGGSYGRESGPGGGWRREGGYGSRSHGENRYGSVSHSESGSSSGWRGESGYGRGGYGGWGRGSVSNDSGFNSSGGGRGRSHHVGSFFSGNRRGGQSWTSGSG